jgi:hypothetical protein
MMVAPSAKTLWFERGLGPRHRGGRFGRGAEPPAEGNQRFQRKPIVLPIVLQV